MTLSITKRIYFSCAHGYPGHEMIRRNSIVNPQQQSHFGSNFSLYVSAVGPLNRQTGMILSLSDLKSAVLPIINQVFDHQNLNDTPHPLDIALKIWHEISPAIPKNIQLSQVLLVDEMGEGGIIHGNLKEKILCLGDYKQIQITTSDTKLFDNIPLLASLEHSIKPHLDLPALKSAIQVIFQGYPGTSFLIRVQPQLSISISECGHFLVLDTWFSFPHQISSPLLSAEECERVFGHCVNLHGHNFRLRTRISEQDCFDDNVMRTWQTKISIALNKVALGFEKSFVGQLGTCERLLQETIFPGVVELMGPAITSIQLRETENNIISLSINNNDTASYFN